MWYGHGGTSNKHSLKLDMTKIWSFSSTYLACGVGLFEKCLGFQWFC